MDASFSSAATRDVALLIFALGGACLAVVAQHTHFLSGAIGWLRKDPLVRVLLVVGLLSTGPITLRSKDGAPNRSVESTQIFETAPPFACYEAKTNGVAMVGPTTNAIVSRACLLHGASETGEWIESGTPFFRWGTNDIRRLYASPGCLSFRTKRHPYLGDSLPNGTPAESLVALRMPLGIAQEENWAFLEGTGVVSRFWHDNLPGGGRVFTWENTLLDRLSGRPATVQVELRQSGDFVYRYDFSQAAPTNAFLVGAQKVAAAVEALRIGNAETNSATVYRLDGDTATNGVSIADLFATAPLLELRWKNVSGLGDLSGDTDDDGLTDWDEVFLHGTDPDHADTDGDGKPDLSELAWGEDPFNADENGDGVPDGVSAADWAEHPLWAANSIDGGNIRIVLSEPIPTNATATLVLGTLPIPLREAATWTFCLPEGETVEGRLFSRGVDAVTLSLSPVEEEPVQLRGVSDFHPAPRLLDDPRGVFDGNSSEGTFRLAVPKVTICNLDGSEAESEIVHDYHDHRDYIVRIEPEDWGLSLDDCWLDGFERDGNGVIRLSIGGDAYDSVMGNVELWTYVLDYGIVSDSIALMRCPMSSDEPYPVALEIGVGETNAFKRILPRRSTNPAGLPLKLCKVALTNRVEHPATVHLSCPNLRFGPAWNDSLTVTLTESAPEHVFYVYGDEASETMDDAVVRVCRDDGDGPLCASNTMTVVWVDPISIRCGQGDAFSADNSCGIQPSPPYLGLHSVSFSGNYRSSIGHVVEIKGTVHPGNLRETLEFKREILDQVVAIVPYEGDFSYITNSLQMNRALPEAIDPMWPELQDLYPFPFGHIYDIDAPGISYSDFQRQPFGTRIFARYNFVQYACVNGVRCSDDFPWHANLAVAKGTESNTNGVFTATRRGHPEDNSVGSGHTSPSIWQQR